ncbi:nitrile hydratase subunit beta [Epibacterium ulvae]|uniref:nitrile hydratase subunit beta n=1 Tax=Epibacterium ulvae TaxID=1156985 RepID=UPI001BFC2DF1|nr:nitrile hydratase subunit beta [Epibacterium ulvae]MBT8154081.1 nitrile hydratase subunit beta [Epibacterium ulvae]
MDGIHDCGGMDGHGPVLPEKNEPVFHGDWERRMFGLNWAIGMNGFWNQDEYRHAMENRPVLDYLGDPYYAKWLYGVETLLVGKGIATAAEIAEARALPPQKKVGGVETPLTAEIVPQIIKDGFTFRREADAKPAYAVGDKILTRNIFIKGHTRLPRYAREKIGVITQHHGIFSFNDSAANEQDERPQHLYTATFTARELWGPEASAIDKLNLNVWEEHIDPAPSGR